MTLCLQVDEEPSDDDTEESDSDDDSQQDNEEEAAARAERRRKRDDRLAFLALNSNPVKVPQPLEIGEWEWQEHTEEFGITGLYGFYDITLCVSMI